MSEAEELYNILEQMVHKAEIKDEGGVRALNKSYNKLAPVVLPRFPAHLHQEYDNCRISCITSLTMFKGVYDEMILDAKEILSKIPKP